MTERNRSFVQRRYSVNVTSARFARRGDLTRARLSSDRSEYFSICDGCRSATPAAIEQLVYELASSISQLDSGMNTGFTVPAARCWMVFPKTLNENFFSAMPLLNEMRNFWFDATDALAEVTAVGVYEPGNAISPLS